MCKDWHQCTIRGKVKDIENVYITIGKQDLNRNKPQVHMMSKMFTRMDCFSNM